MSDDSKLYLGVDVGGTKILAVLACPDGRIIARRRTSTPRTNRPADTVRAIRTVMEELLQATGTSPRRLGGIGMGIPGIANTTGTKIIFTPNMNLAGVEIVGPLHRRFGAAVVLGNDANLGALGEKWLGAARSARNAVGIFVGTGVGGGIIQDGRMLVGSRGAAAEIGHMTLQIGGPRCGCGAHGCLESLASRTAIERDIKAGIAAGKKTAIVDILGKRPKLIRSSALKEAIERKDALVCGVMKNVARALAEACLSMRHLLDPDVIVLGGGVMEACGAYLMPIIQKLIAADPIKVPGRPAQVVLSMLGDDAVALGAVAMAQMAAGKELSTAPRPTGIEYPIISDVRLGQVTIGDKKYMDDVIVRVDGKVKKRQKVLAKVGTADYEIAAQEVAKVCKGNPELLIIGTGNECVVSLTPGARKLLQKRRIAFKSLPTPKAAELYNKIRGSKAVLLRVMC